MVGRCITVGYDTAAPTLLINNLAILSSVVSCHNGTFSKIGLDNDVTVYRIASAKFSWVFNFTNFANFQPFGKMFPQKLLTHDTVFML